MGKWQLKMGKHRTESVLVMTSLCQFHIIAGFIGVLLGVNLIFRSDVGAIKYTVWPSRATSFNSTPLLHVQVALVAL